MQTLHAWQAAISFDLALEDGSFRVLPDYPGWQLGVDIGFSKRAIMS